jgi:hypothetical protein
MSHSSRNCVCSKDIETKTKYFLPQLKRICRAKKTEREVLLKQLSPCGVRYICDCSLALLSDVIQLPTNVYKKLSKYKEDLLYLVKKRPSLRQRRARLVEKQGGFLPFLLPALVSGIASLGGKLLGDYITQP